MASTSDFGEQQARETQTIPLSEWQVSPELVLVKMDPFEMHDGAEIDRRAWEALLGGELSKVWDEVLVNEGDEILVGGSLPIKLILAPYIINTQTGLADEALRSDVDLLATHSDVMERLKQSSFISGSTSMAAQLKVSDIKIDCVSEEQIRELNVKALEELRGLVDSKIIDDFLNKVADSNTGELLQLHSFFDHESLSIRLVKTGGEIRAFISDPADVLTDDYYHKGIPSIKAQLAAQAGVDSFFGFVTEPNLESVKALYLHAFLSLQKAELTTKVPLQALEAAFNRYIKAVCELDISTFGDGHPQNHFTYLHAVAERFVNNESVFTVPENVFSKVDKEKGIETVQDFIRYKVQEALARGSASNVETAMSYVVAFFPMGSYISEEVGKFFRPLHEIYPPNNLLSASLYFVKPGDLPTRSGDIYHPDIPAVNALVNFYRLTALNYGLKQTPVEGINPNDLSEVYYANMAGTPQGMNEIMAMLFTSMEWTPENNMEEIRNVVNNWRLAGQLKMTWRTKSFEFDTSLNLEDIIEKIPEYKCALEQDRESRKNHDEI